MAVKIVERKPAAIVRCGDQNMQMDLDGIMFSEATADGKGALPLMTGLCDSSPMKGDPVAARSLEQIRELLSAIDSSKSWLSGTAINECRWSEAELPLFLAKGPCRSTSGRALSSKRLQN